MSRMQPQARIVSGAVPLNRPAWVNRGGSIPPGTGRIVAAIFLAAIGLLAGSVVGIVLVFATGLVALC